MTAFTRAGLVLVAAALLLAALVAATFGPGGSGFAVAAGAWELDDIDDYIDQTTFSVDDGCSGTLLSRERREVLTAYHCVSHRILKKRGEDGETERIEFQTVALVQSIWRDFEEVERREYTSHIRAYSEDRDLALLVTEEALVQTREAQIAPPGTVVRRGERVWVIGNPLGRDGSLHPGMISHAGRVDSFGIPTYQLYGGISVGFSGGGVYNEAGQMIGIVTSVAVDLDHLMPIPAEQIGFVTALPVIRDFLGEQRTAARLSARDCDVDLELALYHSIHGHDVPEGRWEDLPAELVQPYMDVFNAAEPVTAYEADAIRIYDYSGLIELAFVQDGLVCRVHTVDRDFHGAIMARIGAAG